MQEIIKRLASWAPTAWQQDLKRWHMRRLIRKKIFTGDEPEFFCLDQWVSPGDWVLDVGANVGHYTLRLSELVGPEGRIIAFEPVADSFELLAANVSYRRLRNVTLMNVGASNRQSLLGMNVPKLASGLSNFYMAHMTTEPSDFQVMCIAIDDLPVFEKISLVKIDAEGHELQVLEGMRRLIERDAPTLIVEDNSEAIVSFMTALGYAVEKLPGSPNRVFTRAPQLVGRNEPKQ